mmetsp:Transcript_122758/g.354858  ORF Transcript_122758/g.354858 Transcript_122758/m.354858 type:complete len:233 (-) Transcript_122758:556-1254(-)
MSSLGSCTWRSSSSICCLNSCLHSAITCASKSRRTRHRCCAFATPILTQRSGLHDFSSNTTSSAPLASISRCTSNSNSSPHESSVQTSAATNGLCESPDICRRTSSAPPAPQRMSNTTTVAAWLAEAPTGFGATSSSDMTTRQPQRFPTSTTVCTGPECCTNIRPVSSSKQSRLALNSEHWAPRSRPPCCAACLLRRGEAARNDNEAASTAGTTLGPNICMKPGSAGSCPSC